LAPVFSRRLIDEGVDRLVQDFDPARPGHLQGPNHPENLVFIKKLNFTKFQNFQLASW